MLLIQILAFFAHFLLRIQFIIVKPGHWEIENVRDEIMGQGELKFPAHVIGGIDNV